MFNSASLRSLKNCYLQGAFSAAYNTHAHTFITVATPSRDPGRRKTFVFRLAKTGLASTGLVGPPVMTRRLHLLTIACVQTHMHSKTRNRGTISRCFIYYLPRRHDATEPSELLSGSSVVPALEPSEAPKHDSRKDPTIRTVDQRR